MTDAKPETPWDTALILPEYLTLHESMVRELAEYLRDDPKQVAADCEAGCRKVAEDWRALGLAKSSSAEQITGFYRGNRAFLYDLTWFNSHYRYVDELALILGEARKRGLNIYLDYGAGIGSVGIYFARAGFAVTLADVSEPLQRYAEWRFRRRGLHADFINLNMTGLPEGRFDVVTALDVLEHVARPGDVVGSIARSMKVGGLFAFNVEDAGPRHPQHVTTYDDVLALTRSKGFRREEHATSFELYMRVSRPSALSYFYSGLDPIWYKGIRRPAVRVLNFLGLKERVKRLLTSGEDRRSASRR